MMKMWTQIWASVSLTFIQEAIMTGLLDIVGVGLLGIGLQALRNE